MYDNTMCGFCQDFAGRFLSQRLILFQDGVQPQLPGAGQQVAVAAQKRLPLVDALLDEVGVHLEVEHHCVPLQAEQALFQLFFQLGVVALVLVVAGDAGRKQSLGGLGWGLQHKASSFVNK